MKEEKSLFSINPENIDNYNFIQTRFGYCFYTLGSNPFIYNLYVHPWCRRCGHSKELLTLVIEEIRKKNKQDKIYVEVEPREDSISFQALSEYYKSMGLTLYSSNNNLLEEK